MVIMAVGDAAKIHGPLTAWSWALAYECEVANGAALLQRIKQQV